MMPWGIPQQGANDASSSEAFPSGGEWCIEAFPSGGEWCIEAFPSGGRMMPWGIILLFFLNEQMKKIIPQKFIIFPNMYDSGLI